MYAGAPTKTIPWVKSYIEENIADFFTIVTVFIKDNSGHTS